MMQYDRKGFTLVEILIVVIILGILAAIVIPQVSTASQDSRLTSARETLQKARSQIEVFKAEHGGCPPQTTALWAIMLHQSSTTETNVTNPSGTRFGPYFQVAPVNGINNFSTVSSATVDTQAGFYYSCDALTSQLLLRNLDGSINTTY